jgi:membrane protease YdiL (CAAX protease family)
VIARARHATRRPHAGELSRHQRRAIYGTGSALLLTGLLWLLFHYALQQPGEFGPRPHPLEYQCLRLHGAAAMLALVAFGSLLPGHLQRGWQRRQNRGAGVVITGLVIAMAVTGYGLYYLATENSRGWISALHWILGLAAVPALAWHGLSARRLRLRAPRELAPRPAPHPETPAPDARLH